MDSLYKRVILLALRMCICFIHTCSVHFISVQQFWFCIINYCEQLNTTMWCFVLWMRYLYRKTETLLHLQLYTEIKYKVFSCKCVTQFFSFCVYFIAFRRQNKHRVYIYIYIYIYRLRLELSNSFKRCWLFPWKYCYEALPLEKIKFFNRYAFKLKAHLKI